MHRDMKSLKFDVFGREVLIIEKGDGWKVFYLGNEGKPRQAQDIDVPESDWLPRAGKGNRSIDCSAAI